MAVESAKAVLTVEDPEAVYHDIISGADHRARRVWWEVSTSLGLEVTVFGNEGQGCQSWIVDIETPPSWVPDPPEWFRLAVEEIMEEEA